MSTLMDITLMSIKYIGIAKMEHITRILLKVSSKKMDSSLKLLMAVSMILLAIL
jgi:hypothetical protein